MTLPVIVPLFRALIVPLLVTSMIINGVVSVAVLFRLFWLIAASRLAPSRVIVPPNALVIDPDTKVPFTVSVPALEKFTLVNSRFPVAGTIRVPPALLLNASAPVP